MAQTEDEEGIQPIYTRSVPAPDGSHLHNLSFKEFHSVVLAQDARVDHPVVLLDCEDTSEELNSHGTTSASMIARAVCSSLHNFREGDHESREQILSSEGIPFSEQLRRPVSPIDGYRLCLGGRRPPS